MVISQRYECCRHGRLSDDRFHVMCGRDGRRCECWSLVGRMDGECPFGGNEAEERDVEIGCDSFSICENGIRLVYDKSNGMFADEAFMTVGFDCFDEDDILMKKVSSVSEACEFLLEGVGRLENDLRTKLETIGSLKDRLAKGMLENEFQMTDKEIAKCSKWLIAQGRHEQKESDGE